VAVLGTERDLAKTVYTISLRQVFERLHLG
jgi:hypothetical protein